MTDTEARDPATQAEPDAGPLVSVVVAAYNESATIAQVLRKVAALPWRTEIVVVDDGSIDDTRDVLDRLQREELSDLHVESHARNRGKGAALRTGIALSHGDIVVFQDADLEYDPADVPRLLAPILGGHADAVYGTRLRGGQPQRAHMFWHYAGNRLLTLLVNVLYNTTISDMETGYKAFRGELIRSLELVSEDFRIEPEVTARLLRRGGVRLYEIPISYYGRTYAEGKKITWRDGLLAVGALVRFRVD